MRLRYTPRAIADIEAIADYVTERSPAGARNLRLAIETAIGQLEQFPGLGSPQTADGVRKLVVRQYPYLIYYFADGDTSDVVILTVQHSSRERPFEDA